MVQAIASREEVPQCQCDSDYARQRGRVVAPGNYCSPACPFGQLVARAITVWFLVGRSAAHWWKRTNAKCGASPIRVIVVAMEPEEESNVTSAPS